MSSCLADEPNEAKLEARPSRWVVFLHYLHISISLVLYYFSKIYSIYSNRLGLGAKVSRQFKIGPSNDPIERKLYAKLDVGKRNSVNGAIKDYAPSARNGSDNSDDSDEDLESRTKSFGKKRVVPSSSSPQINKKRK